jgi:hypothetical protein
MTTSSYFNFNLRNAWRSSLAGITAVALGFTTLSAQAPDDADDEEEKPYIAIRAADADSLTLARTGDVTLSMMRAPSSSADAKLLIVNSANFTIWEGDLRQSGANWMGHFNLDAAEALLTASAVNAEFPGAATGGKDLRISFVRDVLTESLTASAALFGEEPMFYTAPSVPEPIAPLAANPDATQVASYAMAARRYDEQLAAYRFNLMAAKSSARSLWTDLMTAGKLDKWPAAIRSAQAGAYDKLDEYESQVTEMKRANRAAARNAVEQWNAANPEADPIELPFRDHSIES